MISKLSMYCIKTPSISRRFLKFQLLKVSWEKAALMKQCIRVGDVRKDVRENCRILFLILDNKQIFTTYSVLCSPLIVSDECIGVIHCLIKTDNKLFEESDRKLFRNFIWSCCI